MDNKAPDIYRLTMKLGIEEVKNSAYDASLIFYASQYIAFTCGIAPICWSCPRDKFSVYGNNDKATKELVNGLPLTSALEASKKRQGAHKGFKEAYEPLEKFANNKDSYIISWDTQANIWIGRKPFSSSREYSQSKTLLYMNKKTIDSIYEKYFAKDITYRNELANRILNAINALNTRGRGSKWNKEMRSIADSLRNRENPEWWKLYFSHRDMENNKCHALFEDFSIDFRDSNKLTMPIWDNKSEQLMDIFGCKDYIEAFVKYTLGWISYYVKVDWKSLGPKLLNPGAIRGLCFMMGGTINHAADNLCTSRELAALSYENIQNDGRISIKENDKLLLKVDDFSSSLSDSELEDLIFEYMLQDISKSEGVDISNLRMYPSTGKISEQKYEFLVENIKDEQFYTCQVKNQANVPNLYGYFDEPDITSSSFSRIYLFSGKSNYELSTEDKPLDYEVLWGDKSNNESVGKLMPNQTVSRENNNIILSKTGHRTKLILINPKNLFSIVETEFKAKKGHFYNILHDYYKISE